MKRLSNYTKPLFLAIHSKASISKIIITLVMICSFLLLPRYAFRPLGAEGFDIYHNILFPLSHANIFHLALNIICLWQLRFSVRCLAVAFAISFMASLIPGSQIDVMGASGVIFSIIGIRYGQLNMPRKMVCAALPVFIITALLPNVAVLFHIWCLIIAFIVGWVHKTYCLWTKISCI